MPREVESLQKNKATEFEYRKLFTLEEGELANQKRNKEAEFESHLSLTLEEEQNTEQLSKSVLVLPEMIPATELELPKKREHVSIPQKNYKHIGFQAAHSRAEKKDSKYMAAVRRSMQTYFSLRDVYLEKKNKKDITDNEKEAYLREMIAALKELNAKCDFYISNRNPWFARGKERMAEVKELQKDANDRLLSLQRDYANVCDLFVKKRAMAAEKTEESHVKNRRKDPTEDYWFEHMDKGKNDLVYDKESVSEMKFREGRSKNEQIADFSGFDNMLASEHANVSTKEILIAKTAVDLTRTKLSDELKNLLKKISSYASIRTTASDYGLVFFQYNREQKRLFRKYTADFAEEERLIKEIPQLIETALADDSITAENAAMLRSYQQIFSGFVSGQLVVHKLLHYNQELDFHDFTGKDVTEQWTDKEYDEKTKNTILTPVELELHDRSADPLFPHPPCVSDIAQGGMGNCWFLSSLSDLLAHDSDSVRNMMKDNGDGTVTVRFFAPYDHTYRGNNYQEMAPVYIKVDKKVNLQTNRIALWVQIVSKAYCAFTHMRLKKLPEKDQLWNENNLYKNIPKDKMVIDYGYIANGGQMRNCMPFLTGRINSRRIDLQGGISEIETEDTFMAQVYENSVKEDARKEAEKTASVVDKEFGVYKTQWSYVVTVHKEVLDEACSVGMDKVVQNMKRLKEVEQKTTDLRASLEVANDLVKRLIMDGPGMRFLNNEGIIFRKVVRGELDPEKLNSNEQRLYEKAYDYVKENFDFLEGYCRGESEIKKFVYKSFDELMNASGQGLKALKDEAEALKQYAESDREKIRLDKDVEPPKLSVEKTAKLKVALALDKAAGQLISHVDVDVQGRDFRKMFRQRKKSVEALKYADIPVLKDGKTDWIEDIVVLMAIPREQAFELAKKQAIKTLSKIESAYDEAENSKNMEVFSGEYSERALQTFQDIKKMLAEGQYLGSGSRQGWGKVSKWGRESMDEGTAGNHAYAILGTKEVTMDGKRIYLLKVRNPWGQYSTEYYRNAKTGKMGFRTNETNDSGVFYMELTHFFRVFNTLHTSGDKWNNEKG